VWPRLLLTKHACILPTPLAVTKPSGAATSTDSGLRCCSSAPISFRSGD
jgi:hypothetical protein